ncbi:glycosyl hydrolase 38 domain protein [Terriglobus saanensis SP1PR4]|uniref:Glycosyl hydrolase 38 domain protein n=2 Tax=Terriglobus saanensis TaxID=870903 RepID=E8V415_TERSS|nr:glycosyl hydrolase 38 domain protein [Terriglobus saanensis SP1PR4]
MVKMRRFAAVAMVCATVVVAQSRTAAQKGLVLSPKATEVLKTLDALSSLPDGPWRYHSGDVPHGEAVDLDDSSWKSVTKEAKADRDAGWFRRTIEVPKTLDGYDLTGARIWFQFHAGANGPMPQIIYFNGRRVALGDDLEAIVLSESAKPGEKIEVAVKLLATIDEKTFRGATFKIESSKSRPSPSDLRTEGITAATLLPVLQGFKPEMEDKIDSIIASVDIAGLHKANQIAFDASLKRVHRELMQFEPMLKTAVIDLDGNSHIDAAWLWPWTETVDAVKRTWGTALQLMNEYPDYKFTQSAAQYNVWMKDKYPAMNEEIKKRVAEGRWEIVGGMWVEPDLNMPDGESLVRQLLIGKRFFKKEYGVDVRIGWNPDSFGYTWQLPQIYKKSGVDYFVTQKMHWNDTNQLPFRTFWWESPDGSKVLTYFPTDYTHSNLNPNRLAKDFVESTQRLNGFTHLLDLYGVGDHGGGPTRDVLDEGLRWMKPDTVAPTLRFSTAQSYFTSVEKTLETESPQWNYDSLAKGFTVPAMGSEGKLHIPTWKDELYFEYHRGVYTTQAGHKAYMRESEEALLNSEKYASLAWLKGVTYPTSDFEDSWKKVTFNQFHDLGAGSGIGVIYKEAAEDYKHVFQQARDADMASLPALLATVDTQAGKGVPVAIFNPLAWERSDAVVTVEVQMPEATPDGVHVVDAKGKVLLSQVLSSNNKTNSYKLLVKTSAVPSLGYTVLHVLPGQKSASTDVHASGLTLENSRLKLVVDAKSGCITSLVEKKTGFETIAAGGCGNQLQTFKDTPKQYDAWNIDPGTLDHFTPIESVESVQLLDKGPLRATIRVTRTWQKSHFVQDISLDAEADAATIQNEFDWHEEHVLLKASFPMAATSAKATYEIPYGTIERPTARVNSFEKAEFEVPAMRWAELGDGKHGVSLLNRTKFGYDAVDNLLRLTLLRSATWPDPVADLGHQSFQYAIYPHAGDWKQAGSMQHGWEYNYPLRAMQVAAHAGADAATKGFASVGASNVVVTAIKKAEDRDALVVRMFEFEGKDGDVKVSLPAGATYAVASDLMENPDAAHLPVTDGAVTVHVHPYEIVTLQAMYSPQ